MDKPLLVRKPKLILPLRQKRYAHAMKMLEKYYSLQVKAEKGMKKWQKKCKYYAKVLST